METVREIQINMEFSVVPQMLLGPQHSIHWRLINFGFWGTHQIPCTFRMRIHPLKKEINFPWRLATRFSASFQKAYTFEQDLKSSAVSKRPENPYGKNEHTGYTTCLFLNQSSETEKKENTNLYTCFKTPALMQSCSKPGHSNVHANKHPVVLSEGSGGIMKCI